MALYFLCKNAIFMYTVCPSSSWYYHDPDGSKDEIFTEKYGAVQVHFGKVCNFAVIIIIIILKTTKYHSWIFELKNYGLPYIDVIFPSKKEKLHHLLLLDTLIDSPYHYGVNKFLALINPFQSHNSIPMILDSPFAVYFMWQCDNCHMLYAQILCEYVCKYNN